MCLGFFILGVDHDSHEIDGNLKKFQTDCSTTCYDNGTCVIDCGDFIEVFPLGMQCDPDGSCEFYELAERSSCNMACKLACFLHIDGDSCNCNDCGTSIQKFQLTDEKLASSIALESMECAYKCLNIRNITATIMCYTSCLLGEREEVTEAATTAPTITTTKKGVAKRSAHGDEVLSEENNSDDHEEINTRV